MCCYLTHLFLSSIRIVSYPYIDGNGPVSRFPCFLCYSFINIAACSPPTIRRSTTSSTRTTATAAHCRLRYRDQRRSHKDRCVTAKNIVAIVIRIVGITVVAHIVLYIPRRRRGLYSTTLTAGTVRHRRIVPEPLIQKSIGLFLSTPRHITHKTTKSLTKNTGKQTHTNTRGNVA